MAFRGKAPGSGAGEMSTRTKALRPELALSPREVEEARRLRRGGAPAEAIAAAMGKPVEDVEQALLQMRMPRPETTRGTLNVTLAAHRLVLAERLGDEPLWQTFDRMLDELLRLRAAAERDPGRALPSRPGPARSTRPRPPALPTLPGL